jgi:hypothetical protein
MYKKGVALELQLIFTQIAYEGRDPWDTLKCKYQMGRGCRDHNVTSYYLYKNII